MKSYEIAITWLYLLFGIGLAIWVPYIWIRRTRLIKWEKAEGWTMLNQANLKKYDKQYNLGVKIILGVCTIIYAIIMIPTYQDVLYLLKREYMEIRGTVAEGQGDNASNNWLETVLVKDEKTGKIERFDTGRYNLKKGYHVYIRYLPHSRTGSIIDYTKGSLSEYYP